VCGIAHRIKERILILGRLHIQIRNRELLDSVSRKKAPKGLRPNRLLALLPEPVRARIGAQAEAVDLPVGRVIQESGEPIRHIWFPEDCIVSLVNLVADGAAAEIAVVGPEGMIGLPGVVGAESTPSEAVVQAAGSALRVPLAKVADEFRADAGVRRLLLLYGQALFAQVAQTAVCNRHHTIEQQVGRWLLMSLDRLPGDDVSVTQEMIANMLGVRREGVTDAARKLQAQAIIEYSRGRIRVLDRQALERASCECYAVVRDESQRLLGFPEPAPRS
jgi:CRP-like cAMP-binding protein